MDNQPFGPQQPTTPPTPSTSPQVPPASPVAPPATLFGNTPPPTSNDTNFVVQPPAPKKPGAGLIITAITLAVLLLGALGVIAYLLFFQPVATTEEKVTDTTDTSNQAQSLVAKAKTAVVEVLKTDYTDATINDTSFTPLYKAADTPYAVTGGTFGYGFETNPTKDSSYDQTALTAVQRSISTLIESDKSYKKTTKAWEIDYQNESVICSVSIDTSPVNFSCANIADYKNLISAVEPYATAYLASDQGKQYGEGVAFGMPTIAQKANGYSNAQVSVTNTNSPVGGFAGLFYAKDGNWAFWKGTQSILGCTEYNTVDLQHSFEGDVCWDDATNKESTVAITLK